MELFDDPAPAPGNQPEYSVSELSGAVKRVIEGEFGLVRVRGEVGRVSRPASGHLYYDLKDDRSQIAAITWKGQAARLTVRPEEGMEVVATGRMTTFPGQSKYQLIIDDLTPAGAGALMAMLEKRRAALAAEGLFDAARKKPIPYLPRVIGVITSPSGAVIRDILHRLRERFPRPVLIWPVAVQGERCAAEVAAAIRGFNALPEGGPIPRPDLLIVARGGGSLEDLWGFNEEIVVRAAAASRIPLISAVGHETDTTLIDHAADLRAPTPTAAAERAVPVRLDLIAQLQALSARLGRILRASAERRRQRLADLSRALPRPDALTGPARQRLDHGAGRLGGALGLLAARKRGSLDRVAGRMRADLLLGLVARRRDRLAALAGAAEARLDRRLDARRAGFDKWASRLAPALARLIGDAARRGAEGQARLAALSHRLEAAPGARIARLRDRLEAVDRTRASLGHAETLARGFAIVRGATGGVVADAPAAAAAPRLEIEFRNGRVAVQPLAGPAAADAPAAALSAASGATAPRQTAPLSPAPLNPAPRNPAPRKGRTGGPDGGSGDEGQGRLF